MIEASRPGKPPAGGQVLVVEDDPAVRESLDAILSGEFATTSVAGVAQAVQTLSRQAFDVVVTDFNLADGTGLTVIDSCRAQSPGATVILLTGHVDYDGVRALQKSGRVLVLFKPVNPDELLAWVKNGVTMARLAAATTRLAARANARDAAPGAPQDSPPPRGPQAR